MKKGFVWSAIIIPLLFTLIATSVIFISLKGTIIRVVDLEFSQDNVHATLNALLVSSVFDKESNREQTIMELLGENSANIPDQTEEILDQSLVPDSALCLQGSKDCKIEGILNIVLTRLDQLVFSRCYKLEAIDDDRVIIDSQAKRLESIARTGIKECRIQFPAFTKIPLPYNDGDADDLAVELRLRIE